MSVEPNPNSCVGNAIKRRRLQLHLSQAKLAEQAGVSVNTIQRAEYGDYPTSPLSDVAIARALGWAPDMFDRIRAGESPDRPDDPSEPGGQGVDIGVSETELNEQIGRLLEGITALTSRVKENDGNVSALTQMHGDQLVRLHQLEARLAEVEARIGKPNS